MVAINNTISEKGDGAEVLLKNSKAEYISVPIGVVGTVRTKKSRCVGFSIVIVLLLCTVTLAAGFWLRSERKLPPFCYPCDKLKKTGTVLKANTTCCINTESEYVHSMKHMLNTLVPESSPGGYEDPQAAVAEKEMQMLEAKNETITLLHSSPVAAHVLVACTNSSYYPYPQKDLPPTRTLELLPGRSLSLLRGVELNEDHLVIQTKGRYLIYSQIMGLNVPDHIVERYNTRIPNDGIQKLLQSTHTLPKRVYPGNTMFDFHTSYISGVVELEVNDEVFVTASLDADISRNHTLNYLGLVKLDG